MGGEPEKKHIKLIADNILDILGDQHSKKINLLTARKVPASKIYEIVRPEYSCSLRKIDMVKAVDGREFNNVAGLPCSYGTTVRRVAVQGLVCSPWMVVIQIRRHKSLEMPLAENDDVIEKFSA